MTNQTIKVTPQVPALAGMAPLGISPRRGTVCDGCLTTAYDMDAEMNEETQALVCVKLGADIPDHLCDAREEPETGRCSCACNSSMPARTLSAHPFGGINPD